jgi:hypothetical protein
LSKKKKLRKITHEVQQTFNILPKYKYGLNLGAGVDTTKKSSVPLEGKKPSILAAYALKPG